MTFANWTGQKKTEIINLKRFQDLITIGGKIFYETHHAPLIKMQGFVNELYYELTVKGGGNVPVLLNSKQIRDDKGNVLGYKSTFFNITDRKKYEQELLLAKKKAEQAVVAKTEFLSTISHEIRTPLNAIIGLTNILHEQDKNPDNREYLNILKFSSNNLLGLINDILDLSKIEAGKVVLEEKDFDLRQLLHSIAGTFKLKTEKKGVKILVEPDKNLPVAFFGDDLKLGQVFTNLVGNAVKFTEDGSITIKAEVNDKVDKTYQIRFSVKDTGIGIPSNKLESIFEEFTQASSQISIKYGGTGLGQAISQRILELYGGKLMVKSELNKGSEFYFTINLPKGNKDKIIVSPKSIEQERKLSGSKILLCEDNPVNVIVVSKFLKDWDIDFDVAVNGQEGLAKIQEQYYDLILMDIKMPVMDGYETTRAIRELQGDRYSKLPIIAMTASSDLSATPKIENVGMNGFIGKPFDPKDFYNKLVKYLPLNFLSDTSIEALVKDSAEETKTKKAVSLERMLEIAEGDDIFYKGIINESIKSFIEIQDELREAFQNEDLQKAKDIEHKSKMVLDILKAENLASLIKKAICALELKDKKSFASEKYLVPLEKEIEAIVSELKSHN